jgi:membrane-associated protein
MEIFHLDLAKIIETIGYLGVLAIVFAESGLLIGLFLPGDSLLFTAGFLASVGLFNLPLLATSAFLAAVLGDNVGYAFGKRVGPVIFKREDSFWFHKKHVERTQRFYEKHGGKTIILARFVPIVRTLAPVLAGVGNMNYRTFFLYNVVGGFLWAVGLTSLGYFLGSMIPNIDRYILPIIVVIIILSFLPTIWHVIKSRQES